MIDDREAGAYFRSVAHKPRREQGLARGERRQDVLQTGFVHNAAAADLSTTSRELHKISAWQLTEIYMDKNTDSLIAFPHITRNVNVCIWFTKRRQTSYTAALLHVHHTHNTLALVVTYHDNHMWRFINNSGPNIEPWGTPHSLHHHRCKIKVYILDIIIWAPVFSNSMCTRTVTVRHRCRGYYCRKHNMMLFSIPVGIHVYIPATACIMLSSARHSSSPRPSSSQVRN